MEPVDYVRAESTLHPRSSATHIQFRRVPVGATASAGPRDTRGGPGFSRRDSRGSTTDLTGPITARTP